MAANKMNRERRTGEQPYLVFVDDPLAPSWTWKVRKSWQGDNAKEYARWMCEVSSPMTYGGADLGDVYVDEIVSNAFLIEWDQEVFGTVVPDLGVALRYWVAP